MKSLRQRAAPRLVLGFGTALLACGPEPVVVRLVYPTVGHFAMADTAEVVVLKWGGASRCATLTFDALNALVADASRAGGSGRHPACDFAEAAATIDDVAPGRYDFLAVTYDDKGIPLGAGCTTRRFERDAEPIEILVGAVSDAGRGRLGEAASCASIARRCAGACE